MAHKKTTVLIVNIRLPHIFRNIFVAKRVLYLDCVYRILFLSHKYNRIRKSLIFLCGNKKHLLKLVTLQSRESTMVKFLLKRDLGPKQMLVQVLKVFI